MPSKRSWPPGTKSQDTDGEDDSEDHMERRKLSIREIAMIVTLGLNFGSMIWNAATQSAAVAELTRTLNKLDNTVTRVVSDLGDLKVDYNGRISALEMLTNELRRKNGR